MAPEANSECVLLAMGELDGASIGIGAEPVNLCVALVGGAVLLLDLEKEVLHFPKRTAVHGSSKFFDNASHLLSASAKQTRNQLRVALAGEVVAFCRDGRLEILDGTIEVLKPDRIRGLRASQRIHLGMIQTRDKVDLVGVKTPGKMLFQFLRRGENPFPTVVLLLKARAEILHLIVVA